MASGLSAPTGNEQPSGSDQRPTTDQRQGGPTGRQEVVEAILRAARTLIAERGPSGVSLREIAREAAVNNGLVYLYMGTKEQLVAEVFRRAALDAAARFDQVDNLTDALRLLMHAGDEADVRLMAWAALDSSEPSLLFGPASSLESLATIFQRDARSRNEEITPGEARIAAGVAAMVATAWRVFSPVAKSTAAVGEAQTSQFDGAVERLLGSLAAIASTSSTDPKP
jgi:AcrR family transcriptional regulator